MRGCCHLPGVETAGEALWAAEGVAGPFCGVNEATGGAMALFALVAGDWDCVREEVERFREFAEVDWTSEVEDMTIL